MFRLSRKTGFALEAVLDIAYNARAEPVQAREITQRQGIPQRYLEQVMQQLVRAGILKGVRGPRGGYFLARERRRISVGEIIAVVSALEGGDEANDYDSPSDLGRTVIRSEEHTSELQSLMRNSYAVFCLKKKNKPNTHKSN